MEGEPLVSHENMTELYGHTSLRQTLERDLPPVTLLKGPESTGKWALAEYLCEYHDIISSDIRKFEKLSISDVRELHHFVKSGPFSKFKLVIIRLDGKSYYPGDSPSNAALNSLLKLLEESPSTVRFILIASKSTLITIESRSFVYNCGLLSTEDITNILIDNYNMSLKEAKVAASFSRGTISSALSVNSSDKAKVKVLSVLKSIADKDSQLLIQATKGTNPNGRPSWGKDEHTLLLRWVSEALTQQWRVFSKADSFGLDTDKALLKLMLLKLSQLSHAGPRLAVRTALEPLTERK